MTDSSPSPSAVGARLRALARDRGISSLEIQRRTGIHQPNISKIYQGKTSPSVSTVGRILSAMGCVWSDLDEPGATKE